MSTLSEFTRRFESLEDAARYADTVLRGVLVWAGSDWGSPNSLAWAVDGAVEHIRELEQQLAPRHVDQSLPMRAWHFDLGGVDYWVAARDIGEAMQAFVDMDGAPLEDEDAIAIERLSDEAARSTKVRDDNDGDKTLAEVLAETKEPTVVACSEWP